MQNGKQNNALELVSDYVLPQGIIDFQSPAQMVLEYMKKVKENPNDAELKETLKIISDAAKTVVAAGLGQVEQGKMMIQLLQVNRKLKLME